MSRIARILKIRPGEGRMVLFLLGLLLVSSAGMGLGGSGIDALVFTRLGVRSLPALYVVLGPLTLVTMLAASALGGRPDRRMYTRLPIILALILAGERGLLTLNLSWFYPVLWLSKGVIAAFQGMFAWGLAGMACDTRQSRRLFPLFSAGAILGTAIGAALTPPVVSLLHAENLLLAWAALLGVAAAIGWLLSRRKATSTGARRRRPGLASEMRQGFDFVRRSELLRLIAVCAALFSVAWFALEYPFNSAAATAYPNEDALAGFLGIVTGIGTAAGLLISLLAANRLFARFGILPMLMVFPAIYLAGFAILAINAPLPLVAAARFGQIGWAQGVAGTAWGATYQVIPRQRREQARALIDAVPVQLGVMVAGGLLILSQGAFWTGWPYLIGLSAAALTLATLWRANQVYQSALAEAARAGQPEIFVGEEEPFGGFIRDAQAIRLLARGVSDPDPVTRRIAIDMLALLPGHGAGESLAGALRDLSPAIRAAAVSALGASGSEQDILRAAPGLSDPDPEVRAEAARALGRLESPPAAATTRLVALLDDPSPRVRAWSALGLAQRLGTPRAEQILVEMAGSSNPEVKAHGLAALGKLGRPEHFELAAGQVNHPNPAARHAAILALSGINHPRQIDTLVLALADDDAQTREVVAEALRNIGEAAVEPVIAALYVPTMEDRAMIALEGLPIGKAAARKLRDYVLDRAEDAKRYHVMWRTVPASNDERAQLLADSLLVKARRIAIRALRATCLLSPNREDMAQAVEELQSPSLDQQTGALEALRSRTAHAGVIRPLIHLWEPADPPVQAPAGYIMHILQDDDGWLRACAALAAGQTDHWEINSALDALASSDRDPLVRETAAAQLEPPRPDRLPLMSRVLFLRRAALFAGLPPCDLRPIAEIAEQKHFSGGEAICRQGEPGEQMHVITSGDVRVMVNRDSGHAVEIARRGPGDTLGEMAIIGPETRTASAMASGEVHLLAIDREPFEKLLRDRAEISLAVMRVICARIRKKDA